METLLAQTFTAWELIVCDSYSTDGSWEFFQKFGTDPRVRLYQVPREGIYAGWNECVRRAQGEYIYMATSDDTAEPQLLETMLSALAKFPEVDIATCNVTPIDVNSRPLKTNDMLPRPEKIYGDWMQRDHRRHGISEFVAACVGGPVWGSITQTLLRRCLFEKVGLFPAGKPSFADVQWGGRVSLGTDAIHIAKPLATFRIFDDQATAKIDWATAAWTHVQMIRETLQVFHDRLPEQLQTHDATDRLAWPFEVRAFNALHLNPGTLLRDPWHTLRNLGRGLSRQPDLTLRHLAGGGRWRNRPQVDEREYVERCLADFHLPPICSAIDLSADQPK